MYTELYAAWQREVESPELAPLPPNFYPKVSAYMKRIVEETSAIDKKTLKAALLDHEMQNVKHLVRQLTRIRYKKLKKVIAENQKFPSGVLTPEEEKVCHGFLGFTQVYRAFAKSLFQGETTKIEAETSIGMPQRRVVVRFLKPIPAIVGSDMRTYGPFAAEDVGSLPVENARILVKQGLAAIIDTH